MFQNLKITMQKKRLKFFFNLYNFLNSLLFYQNLEEFIKDCEQEGILSCAKHVKGLIIQLGSALQFIHNHLQILHNDLKPANILLYVII